MLVGPAPSTFLALERRLDEKLCPLILFLTFAHLSWNIAHSTLHDVSHMANLFTCWAWNPPKSCFRGQRNSFDQIVL